MDEIVDEEMRGARLQAELSKRFPSKLGELRVSCGSAQNPDEVNDQIRK